MLRKATNSDSNDISNLVFDILKDYGLEPDPETTDSDLKDIEDSYFSRGGLFYVYEDNGSIVASMGIYPLDQDTCELRKMYLHSDYRGRGIGKMLMERALTESRELGFKKITLETASVLKEAIALYKSYGFREFKPDHISCRCDQAYIREL